MLSSVLEAASVTNNSKSIYGGGEKWCSLTPFSSS